MLAVRIRFACLLAPVVLLMLGCSTLSHYERGKRLASAGKEAEAVEAYRVGALAGEVPSQLALGRSFFFGRGTERDFEQAKKWFKIAADSGDANAMDFMSLTSRILGDFETANSYLEKAASANNTQSMATLGMLLVIGADIPRDVNRGTQFLLAAAEKNHLDAQLELGRIYRRGDLGQPDFAEAVRWFRRAYDSGGHVYGHELGYMYEHGLGVERDEKKAVDLYKAALSGALAEDSSFSEVPEAAILSGLIVEKGNRNRNDLAIALDLYERALGTMIGSTPVLWELEAFVVRVALGRKKEANEKLESHKREFIAWPAGDPRDRLMFESVIDFYLGTVDEKELLARAESLEVKDNDYLNLRDAWLCTANYYVGRLKFAKRDDLGARRSFEKALQFSRSGLWGYDNALSILRRMSAGSPKETHPPPVGLEPKGTVHTFSTSSTFSISRAR